MKISPSESLARLLERTETLLVEVDLAYRSDHGSVLCCFQDLDVLAMLDKEELGRRYVAEYQALRHLSDYSSQDFYRSYQEIIRHSRGEAWWSLPSDQKDLFLHFKMLSHQEDLAKVEALTQSLAEMKANFELRLARLEESR